MRNKYNLSINQIPLKILLGSLVVISLGCGHGRNEPHHAMGGLPTSKGASFGSPMSQRDPGEEVVSGEVKEVCKTKGCWMEVDSGTGPSKVTFKDYGFFVPSDLKGKRVMMKGKWEDVTLSVKEQKHFLKDAGKAQAEIDAVKEPTKVRRFVSSGVEVQE